MTILSCKLLGYGAWGHGFENWSDLKNIINGKGANEAMAASPKPEIIPANERRRAPLPVKLAVESSWQATQDAGIDPKELSCVFVSGLGDTQLTDYMCKVLATDEKQLSPTKFHNSVHNAAAGYWTISTSCMKAANSVAGYNQSVSLTLLEGITQCIADKSPLLLTFFDAPVSLVLKSLLKNEASFSFSIVIAPNDSQYEGLQLETEIIQAESNWPALNIENDMLNTAYQNNPVARLLPLLEKIVKKDSGLLSVPLSEQTSINLSVS